ncbi:Aerobic respiration control sensor protein ArcB [Chryseobacterium potabilaquae]|uniref:Aerobic respiration control sensor protein ArcB n=2 Tax=Chryseobacterium potabilaquae TaxID=2675057 RepID=A0A6N4X5Z6_9FLAO|nr:Aerobic respiration control sensor protein ArcB [Chryseobacterium potabilaquae]
MMKKHVLIFIFVFCHLHAQMNNLLWYTTDNGLPQNSVKDIIKDKYGFIWISTENGICRFDGVHFLNTNLNTSETRFKSFLGNIEHDSIINSSDGDKIITLIKQRKLSKIVSEKNQFRRDIIFENKKFDKFNKTSYSFIPEPDSRFFIEQDNAQYFFEENLITYYNSSEKHIKKIRVNFKMDDMKKIFVHDNIIFFPNSYHHQMLSLNKGKLTISSENSIYTDPESTIFWSQLNNQTLVINKNDIYLSSYNNNKRTLHKITNYEDFVNILHSLSINTFFYDQENDKIFLGSITKGLYVINLSHFYTARKKNIFADNVYYATLPFSDNSVITPKGYIFNKYSEISQRKSENSINKYSLIYDSHGNILYIKSHSLYKRYKYSDFKKEEVLDVDNLHKIDLIASDNGMYFISSYNNDNSFLNVYHKDDFKHTDCIFKFKTPINYIKKYKENQILLGSTSGGLYIGDIRLKKIKKIASLRIKNIIRTSDQNFWILTKNNGFYLLENNKLIKMPLDKDQYLIDPHTLLEDKKGFFWITTNNGLFKTNAKRLYQYSKNKSTPIIYYRFTQDDGLPTNEFNGGASPTGNVLSNGDMVLPSLDGLLFFSPNEVRSHYIDPDFFFIERAQVGMGEPITFNDTLHLNDNKFENLTIFLDLPYFDNIKNLYIEVLSNDNIWKSLGSERKHSLGKLNPGIHLLKFRFVTSPNGDISYKNVKINIEYLFYQTKTFKILAIITASLLLFLLIRFNYDLLATKNNLLLKTNAELEVTKNELKNRNILQEKLLEAITHDIATPIKHLSNLSKKLDETEDLNLQKKYFHSIHESSETLYKFTLTLSNYGHLFSDALEEQHLYPIDEIFEEKKVLFENISGYNHTTIHIDIPQKLDIPYNKFILTTIIHNIVDNAVKNTHSGIITLSAFYNKDVIIQIIDTGTGMSQELMDYYNHIHNISIEDMKLQKQSGYGLKLTLILIERLNAKISFKKNEPKGSIVEIKLPV